MKKRNVSLLVCVLILTGAVAVYAGKPPGGNTPDKPVTSEINDSDGVNPYDIQSDLQGSYTNGNGIISVLMANGLNRMAHGDWQLDLGQSTRTVTFTLDEGNDVESGEDGYMTQATLLGTVIDDSRFLLQCTRSLQSMLTMHAGNAIVCPLVIEFSNSPFRLNMEFTNLPETEKVQVYCNSEASDGCNEWFITPIPGINGGRTRARLEELVGNHVGKQSSWANRGAFLLKFNIHVTRP